MEFAHITQQLDTLLHVGESMDINARRIVIGGRRAVLYFLQGFLREDVTEDLMRYWMLLENVAFTDAAAFAAQYVPYAAVSNTADTEEMVISVMSGRAVLIVEGLDAAVMADVRNYPARSVTEPENDRILRGAHDGFVETLVRNMALVRRRLRDPEVIMEYVRVGKQTATDAVLCYLPSRADMTLVARLRMALRDIDVRSLSMGQESVVECLVGKQWYNPFPKVRYTERPDCAAAHVAEGRVLLMIDNSPAVMILPTCIFDFSQDTNDFYFPPLVGTFLRWIRTIVFVLTLLLTPVWYILVTHHPTLPDWLSFLELKEPAAVPILVQLLLIELVVDAVKLASLNTPSALSNAFGIVGTLILGEFAIKAGLFMTETVLYMAFASIANFTQPSYELGYAFKLFRLVLLLLSAAAGWWGFGIGVAVMVVMLLSTRTVLGHRYLYPLVPFNGKALLRLVFRLPISRDNT